jgi:hypothetical protein
MRLVNPLLRQEADADKGGHGRGQIDVGPILGQPGSDGPAAGQTTDGDVFAQPLGDVGRLRAVGGQVGGGQVLQGVAVALGQAVVGGQGDVDVVAQVEEALAQLAELLRATGEAVVEDDGPFDLLPVGHEDRLADGVEVGRLVLFVPDGLDLGQGVVVIGRRAGGQRILDANGRKRGNDHGQQQQGQQAEDGEQDGANDAP